VCTPSYTMDVANAVAALIHTKQTGLYHVTNAGSCTWFELARRISELSSLAVDLSPISSKEYAATAQRPAYSVLSLARYERSELPKMRSWDEALLAYLEERERRSRE